MKRTIQTLVFALILTGYAGFAKGSEPFVKVSGKGSKEFFLFMDKVGLDNERGTIFLKKLSGEVIYKEQLKGGQEYRKLFDVNALPAGDYLLEIEDTKRVKSWALSISKEGLQIFQPEDKNYFKPTIVKMDGDKLGISLLNSNLAQARISIYKDGNSEIFFSELLPKDVVLQRVYDLSLLKSGTYTVNVQMNGRIFEEVVKL